MIGGLITTAEKSLIVPWDLNPEVKFKLSLPKRLKVELYTIDPVTELKLKMGVYGEDSKYLLDRLHYVDTLLYDLAEGYKCFSTAVNTFVNYTAVDEKFKASVIEFALEAVKFYPWLVIREDMHREFFNSKEVSPEYVNKDSNFHKHVVVTIFKISSEELGMAVSKVVELANTYDQVTVQGLFYERPVTKKFYKMITKT